MRVTVCQTSDAPDDFAHDWAALTEHTRGEESELVLMPEMAFAPWFAVSPTFDAATWRAAVETHDRWLPRLGELGSAIVLGTRPIDDGDKRFNAAFAWSAAGGYREVHRKAFLPRETGFHESDWYHAGPPDFAPVVVNDISIGVQICTEMWSMGHAQRLGKLGAELIAIPRATSKNSVDKWVAGGRVAGIVSGCFTLSSNRTSPDGGPDLGGGGWISAPDGEVLAVTSRDAPFRTVDIDLSDARRAKTTYPRYALT